VALSGDKIFIENIAFLGHCGVPQTERSALQGFSVSVTLNLDLKPAAESGNLERSVDYEAVANLIVFIGRGESFILLESMAEKMASGVLKQFPVEGVTILLKKKVPPVEVIQGFFGVEITRTRS
jgi:dihydroneopterin aldolase